MRAGKLIALSTVAALAGGTSLVTNLAVGQTSQQSGGAMHGSSLNKGGMHQHQSIGPSQRGAYARANAHELGEAGTGARGLGTMDRAREREIMRSIPRVSSVGTTLRIDAMVPRSVREAAAPLPPEVKRMHPRFRDERIFKYRDQLVIVNPTTSRIVAIVKAPA